MIAARAGLTGILLTSVIACSQERAPAPTPAASDQGRPLPSPLPEIVARVDGRAISLWQILPLAKTEMDGFSDDEKEKRRPEVLRGALEKYIDRELMLQEALRRGISADARAVEWSYDQMRRAHKDEGDWQSFLLVRGYDPRTFRSEIRSRQTVDALIAQEVKSFPIAVREVRAAYEADPMRFAPRGAAGPPPFESVRSEVESALRSERREEIVSALLARLRARARIERLL